mmetsp:Transcript_114583/g.255644  ORF Transcript_114583/g.255644 Transcript_114583/m.255644 type:complete len:358 (+) Transcript_114583:150-1223(+)|eukprot:CAMPEP_0180703616 /NCGR_PEP_ID=MMETSP1038_2-20121128/6727_1 /TAXON_ID=632150 /ORGANISM="Azadinium spinosum, Strain 3D9" /LENGTH=357 /DNA_ID=CAMNT_0022735413 /DNA_START=68 /DNA_END=1141 /DNA_ORIENTATION=-
MACGLTEEAATCIAGSTRAEGAGEAACQHLCLIEPIHDGTSHQSGSAAIWMSKQQFLVHLHSEWKFVANKERPRLSLHRLLHTGVEMAHPRHVLLRHLTLGVFWWVLAHDHNPHIRVPRMDRSHRPQKHRDYDFRGVLAHESLAGEALPVRHEGLVVIVPRRNQGHVAAARVLRNVRHPQHGRPPLRATFTVLALHLVAGDVAIAVAAAIAPIVKGEVPTVPALPAHARCLQAGEVCCIVAELCSCGLKGGVGAPSWQAGQAIAQPRQQEVELVHPCHPEDVAGAEHVKAEVATSPYVGVMLLHILVLGQQDLLQRKRAGPLAEVIVPQPALVGLASAVLDTYPLAGAPLEGEALKL